MEDERRVYPEAFATKVLPTRGRHVALPSDSDEMRATADRIEEAAGAGYPVGPHSLEMAALLRLIAGLSDRVAALEAKG